MSEQNLGWTDKLLAVRIFSLLIFLGLTLFGGQQALQALKNPSPTRVDCSDLPELNTSTWVILEGCELRYTYSAHAYFEGLKSLKTPVLAWVPIHAVGATPDEPALFVLSSGDDDVLGDVKEMEKHLQLAQTADPLLLASQNVSGTREMVIEGWLESIPKQDKAKPDWPKAMSPILSEKSLLLHHDHKPSSWGFISVIFGLALVFGVRAFGRLRRAKSLGAEEFSLLERLFLLVLDLWPSDYKKEQQFQNAESDLLVRVQNVSKRFVKGGAEIRVLQGASLEINMGDRIAIVGQSGSGKSTFLHILGALDKPDQGQIWIHNQPMFMDMDIPTPAEIDIDYHQMTDGQWQHVSTSWRGLIAPWLRGRIPQPPPSGARDRLIEYIELMKSLVSRSRAWYKMSTPLRAPWIGLSRLVSLLMSKRVRIDAIRNKEVGFVFQFHHLLPDQSALRNVMMPMLVAGAPLKEATERARNLLEKVGLGARMGHRPGELSGGEQQRVAIARALVFDPTLLLADEPTGNLDPDTADEIMNLLLQLNEDLGAALVMVTHDHSLARRCPRQYTLKGGDFISGVVR